MADKPKPLAPPRKGMPVYQPDKINIKGRIGSTYSDTTRRGARASTEGQRAARTYLAGKGATKKAIIKKVAGKIAPPVALAIGAHDIYKTGKAAYGAFTAHRHKKKTEAYAKKHYGTVERATKTRKGK